MKNFKLCVLAILAGFVLAGCVAYPYDHDHGHYDHHEHYGDHR